MVEKIVQLIELEEELTNIYWEIREEEKKQIQAHKRSYARRPEWQDVQNRLKECKSKRENVVEQIEKTCEEYRKQVAYISNDYVQDIIAKAKKNGTQGANYVARCVWLSQERLVDTIEMEDILWENQYEDCIAFLKECGIKRVAVTDTSTALMGTVSLLIDNGWKVVGTYKGKPYEFDKRVAFWCNRYCPQKKGLLLEVE